MSRPIGVWRLDDADGTVSIRGTEVVRFIVIYPKRESRRGRRRRGRPRTTKSPDRYRPGGGEGEHSLRRASDLDVRGSAPHAVEPRLSRIIYRLDSTGPGHPLGSLDLFGQRRICRTDASPNEEPRPVYRAPNVRQSWLYPIALAKSPRLRAVRRVINENSRAADYRCGDVSLRFHQPPPNAWKSAAVSVKRLASAPTRLSSACS